MTAIIGQLFPKAFAALQASRDRADLAPARTPAESADAAGGELGDAGARSTLLTAPGGPVLATPPATRKDQLGQ